MKKSLPAPKPSGLSTEKIHWFAESLAKALKLTHGAPLEPVVKRLNGTLVKKPPKSRSTIPDSSYIEVQEDGRFTIFLSTFNFPLEERFTIAHELGHLFLHSFFGRHPIKAEHSGANENEDAEIEAHKFACAFLVPAKDLRIAVEGEIGRDSLAVAAHFMVPEYVALQRMKTLGFVQ